MMMVVVMKLYSGDGIVKSFFRRNTLSGTSGYENVPYNNCILCHINKCQTIVIVHWLVCSCTYITNYIQTKYSVCFFHCSTQHLEQFLAYR